MSLKHQHLQHKSQLTAGKRIFAESVTKRALFLENRFLQAWSLRFAERTLNTDCVVQWSGSWPGREEGSGLQPSQATATHWGTVGRRLEVLTFFSLQLPAWAKPQLHSQPEATSKLFSP